MSWRNDLNRFMRSEPGFFICATVLLLVIGTAILAFINWSLAVIFVLSAVGVGAIAGLIWIGRFLYNLATGGE